MREKMNVVIAGHVDHGKSTLVGRLLTDTNSLPKGKLEQVKKSCQRNSKPFEYAFLIDALKDERAQGITIDTARIFFKSKQRDYLILDAPGHMEFLKNMVTGAARAEAALLVIDASEGIQENSKRHGYMLSMLGIKQIAVMVNKMDLVDYKEQIFEKISTEYRQFLEQINLTPSCFIPISSFHGENIVSISPKMSWYKGETVLTTLDLFSKEPPPTNKPFRMPVQDVYKFTNFGDKRRIIVGTIISGKIKVGDQIIFYPSGKKSRIKSFETLQGPAPTEVASGFATGFTLEEQIYVTRGEIAAKEDQSAPKITTRIRVSLFWLGKKPCAKNKPFILKIGTARVSAKVEEITRTIDASDLSLQKREEEIKRYDVAECIVALNKSIAFDIVSELDQSSRFVMIDNYNICGGGIIHEALADQKSWVRDKALLREFKWEKSLISHQQRAECYNQKSAFILITGCKDVGKKTIAKRLEERLFKSGKIVYFIGIGNILYGVDADIKSPQKTAQERREHMRRLAEISHILLDAGIILIVTAIEICKEDLEIIGTSIPSEKMKIVWIGEEITTNISCDIKIPKLEDNIDREVDKIKFMLEEKNIIFRPW